jgi:hypothetical protein
VVAAQYSHGPGSALVEGAHRVVELLGAGGLAVDAVISVEVGAGRVVLWVERPTLRNSGSIGREHSGQGSA